MIPKDSISEYQKIYKEVHGKEISREEAYSQGTQFINFFQLLLEIDMRNNPENYKNQKSPI